MINFRELAQHDKVKLYLSYLNSIRSSNAIIMVLCVLFNILLVSSAQGLMASILGSNSAAIILLVPVLGGAAFASVYYRADLQMPIVNNILCMINIPLFLWALSGVRIDFLLLIYLFIFVAYAHLTYLGNILNGIKNENKFIQYLFLGILAIVTLIIGSIIKSSSIWLYLFAIIPLFLFTDHEDRRQIKQMNILYFPALAILAISYAIFSASVFSIGIAFSIMILIRYSRKYAAASSLSFIVLFIIGGFMSLTLGADILYSISKPFWLYISSSIAIFLLVDDLKIKLIFEKSTDFGYLTFTKNPFINSIEFKNDGIIHTIEPLTWSKKIYFIDYFNDIVQYFTAKKRNVGVIGLGGGAILRYAAPGANYVFYEIAPDVVSLAKSQFNYLSTTSCKCSIEIGDGRSLIEQAPNDAYDLIIVDGFKGRSLQSHLSTIEAMKIYASKLQPGGVLLIHTSGSSSESFEILAKTVKAAGLCILKANFSKRSLDEFKNAESLSEDTKSKKFQLLTALGLNKCNKYTFGSSWLIAAHKWEDLYLPPHLLTRTSKVVDDLNIKISTDKDI